MKHTRVILIRFFQPEAKNACLYLKICNKVHRVDKQKNIAALLLSSVPKTQVFPFDFNQLYLNLNEF